jgi:DNA-binding transcriptional MerR regulator
MIPDEIHKTYFRISDVAKALDLSVERIRYYDNYFGIVKTRGAANRRKYTVSDLGKMAIIVRLTKYCHLPAIKEILRQNAAESILDILEPNKGKEPVMKIA